MTTIGWSGPDGGASSSGAPRMAAALADQPNEASTLSLTAAGPPMP